MHKLKASQVTVTLQLPQDKDHACGHRSTVPKPAPCESHKRYTFVD